MGPYYTTRPTERTVSTDILGLLKGHPAAEAELAGGPMCLGILREGTQAGSRLGQMVPVVLYPDQRALPFLTKQPDSRGEPTSFETPQILGQHYTQRVLFLRDGDSWAWTVRNFLTTDQVKYPPEKAGRNISDLQVPTASIFLLPKTQAEVDG
ncbi:putative pre-mRNA-splicing factor ATP-dependent RNA helicase DHX32 isoform X1 [Lates japonicus]|uniref:Pre-mRNA-splicing factor ATP-dependent RNA helicase DHX32 isoform X1 n=1 Tax=Lates japonicus TaxID=270547 RepID=A0AAD3MZK6_LATJO|nr:putative pre-mRNA-splicing factor ATP-dependent RNA helicase DHX32 isoform X1 [Lates japonicus]